MVQPNGETLLNVNSKGVCFAPLTAHMGDHTLFHCIYAVCLRQLLSNLLGVAVRGAEISSRPGLINDKFQMAH